ncbi:MAG TPA: hypothetical protein VK543_07795 [Puia sp.]|nr:hypothetical protein [Puia sp.]
MGDGDTVGVPATKWFGNEGQEPVMAIRSDQTVPLSIADVCNGLELLLLYAGQHSYYPFLWRNSRNKSLVAGKIPSCWKKPSDSTGVRIQINKKYRTI